MILYQECPLPFHFLQCLVLQDPILQQVLIYQPNFLQVTTWILSIPSIITSGFLSSERWRSLIPPSPSNWKRSSRSIWKHIVIVKSWSLCSITFVILKRENPAVWIPAVWMRPGLVFELSPVLIGLPHLCSFPDPIARWVKLRCYIDEYDIFDLWVKIIML